MERLTKKEYQEILLAMMAGGDLYAAEIYRKMQRADRLLDLLRPVPIYGPVDELLKRKRIPTI